MEEDDGGNGLFLERVKESNVFSLVEIDIIKTKLELFEKCYLLGILDAQ